MSRSEVVDGDAETLLAYRAAMAKLRTYKLSVLFPAKESFEIEYLLYEQKKTDLLRLVDAHRVLLETRLSHLETLYEAETSYRRLLKTSKMSKDRAR